MRTKRAADQVRLSWTGRTWRDGAPTSSSPSSTSAVSFAGAPLSVVETVGESVGAPAHRLIHGDGLEVLDALAAEGLTGKVDLAYVDPPYASDRDYVSEARLDGPASGRIERTLAYEDRWSIERGGVSAYLDMLAPRLDALTRLLSPRGSIWVHVDWRASYLVRLLLDEILGRDAFKNEIVWRRAPNLGRQATSGQFGRTLDTIVVYGKPEATLRPPTRLEPIEPSAIRRDDQGRPFTSAPRGDYTDASIDKLDAEGRVHRTATGKVYIKYFLVENEEGVLCRERRVDALWTDVPPLRHAPPSERTGFPTQKPRALLERIVSAATEPGSIVVDSFAGSGTTGVAAEALGRRSILIDRSPVAIAVARSRLLRERVTGAGRGRAAGQPFGLHVERSSSAAPPPTKEVTAELAGKRVRLVEPREPLAWAVGTEVDGVFRASWHAERIPGARAVPAELEGDAPSDRDVQVRVFFDDGGVGCWSSGASHPPARKKQRQELARDPS